MIRFEIIRKKLHSLGERNRKLKIKCPMYIIIYPQRYSDLYVCLEW